MIDGYERTPQEDKKLGEKMKKNVLIERYKNFEKPVFNNQAMIEKIRGESRKWIDVPYVHMGGTEGGVDCTKLIALIYTRIGFLKNVDNVYWGSDWMVNSDIEVALMEFIFHLERYVENFNWCLLKFREKMELLTGDIIFMSMNDKGLSNHTGMIFNHEENKIIHAVEKQNGVKILDFSEHWREKATFLIRFFDKV